MADFDPAVALQYRPPSNSMSDIVGPLQAYSLAQNAAYTGALKNIQVQQSQAQFAARQKYEGLVQSGVHPEDAVVQSGMSALDPAGAKQQLDNIEQQNTLGAYRGYDPSNPSTLAKAGPAVVQQGAGVLNTEAQTADQNRKVSIAGQDQRGMIGSGFLTSDQSDTAWQAAVAQAQKAGLIGSLHADQAYRLPQEQRVAIAKSWAGSGVQSAQDSGLATGANEAAKAPYTIIHAAPGESVMAGSGITGGMAGQGAGAPPAPQPGQGRSVATTPSLGGATAAPGGSLATVPVAPAPGTGSRPIAGGFLGSSAAPAASASSSPPMMARAESQYNLPAGYLSRTAQIESGGNVNAHNASGAAGPFQFMPSTWKKYGAPGASPYDPAAATDAAGRLAADNATALTKSLGRAPTGAELYLAHQQGAGGAAALLSNPNAPAASIVGAGAVISNGGTPNMTAGQFAQMWESKFNRSGSGNFSLSGFNSGGPGVAMPSSPAASPYGALGSGPAPVAALALSKPAAPSPADLAPSLSKPVSLPPPVAADPSPPPVAAPSEGRSAAAPPPTQPLLRNTGGAGLSVLKQGMTPFQLHYQEGQASEAIGQESAARNQFVTASDAQRGLMQLQDDLTKLTPPKDANGNPQSSFLAPGSGADTRIGMAKTVNTLLSEAGIKPMFDPDQIAAAESANKTSGRLGFDLAGGLGKGEAGYIVNQAIGLNPSVLNTPQGAKLLIGSLMASQQRQKDFYLHQQDFKTRNGGSPIGSEIDFDQQMPPMQYVQDAKNLARVPPAAVKYLQQHSDQGTISQFNSTYGTGLARYYLGSRTE